MLTPKPILVLAALPLVFVGCTTTNPKKAFDDVSEHVSARADYNVRWMRDDAERDETDKAVAALLQTNLTAQSAVAIALLNNRSLQAEFENIGVSQVELAQASRLKNPQFEGFWRL
ncbi:MAG: RND transporter, partial [Verrucomicrobiota bacterium]